MTKDDAKRITDMLDLLESWNQEYVNRRAEPLEQLRISADIEALCMSQLPTIIAALKSHAALAARDERIRELERTNERLERWKKLIEESPEEAKEVARIRCLEADYMQPIINEWRKRVESLEQQLKAAQAEVEHWKSVSKDCSDNYHAMRSEIEAAADTSRKLKTAQERLAEAEQLLRDVLETTPVDENGHQWGMRAVKEYFAKHSPSSGKEQG